MQEATGSAYLLMIVITLIFIFASYICFSINYTSAMKVANSVLLQIQQDEGVVPSNLTKTLDEAHYRSTGPCDGDSLDDKGWVGFNLYNGNEEDQNAAKTSGNAYYCIKKISATNNDAGIPQRFYYRVKVFYTVDVPLVGALNFNVKADSTHIYAPTDKVAITPVNEI